MSRNDLVGTGVRFEKYGRITGYVTKTSKWNDAKKKEKCERVIHK